MKLKPFKEVHRDVWPDHKPNLCRVYKSSEFLVQVFSEDDGVFRLSICSVKRKGTKWADGITWDKLQAIKNVVGYEAFCAVECYPEKSQVVNVANMRHLFVLPVRPSFAWGAIQ